MTAQQVGQQGVDLMLSDRMATSTSPCLTPSPNAVKDFFLLENTLFARFVSLSPIIRHSKT